VSACRAGLEEVFRNHRLQVPGYIEDERKRIAQRKESRGVLQKTLGEWLQKAAKYLHRTPINAQMWHDIMKAVSTEGIGIEKAQNE
jgi:hypothetical protein